MYDRLTDRSKQAIFAAKEEAAQAGCERTRTAHLLLGLLTVEGGRIRDALSTIGLDREALLLEVRERVQNQSEGPPREPRLLLSSSVKRVIDYAAQEATNLGSNFIDTEHLLLGLIREDNDVDPPILADTGVDLGKALRDIRRLCGKVQAPNAQGHSHRHPA